MSKRIAFINFLETVTSFITNNATVAREWIFPDRDMTVAGVDEVTAESVARAAADTTLQTNIDLKLNRLQPDATAQTDNYTLQFPTDNTDDFLPFNIATDKSLTIPLNSTAAFPIGFQKPIYRTGAGTLSIAVAGGVTVTSTSTGVTDQGAEIPMILRKIGTNTWKLYNGAVPLSWTTHTLTTSNVSGLTSVTSQSSAYIIEGKRINFEASITFVKSGATTVDFTLPFTSARSVYFPIKVTLNGTHSTGMALFTSGTATLTCYATVALGTFAGSQTHTISMSITHQIS
jgi:hypothetical protein